MWKAWEQAEANAGVHEPLLIVKRNQRKPLAVMDAEKFIRRQHEN